MFNDVLVPPRRKARSAADVVTAEAGRVETLMWELAQLREGAKSVREEMQSMNEELQTVNLGLQAKVTGMSHEALRTLVFCERVVTTCNARWFKVRTMPYRTQENRIDGRVITFADVTKRKQLEAELATTQARLAALEVAIPQGGADGLS